MKRIAVFFDAPGFDDYPFDDPEFRQNYHDIAAGLAERGVQFCVARSRDAYLGGTRFSRGWVFSNGAFEPSDGELTADLIWNKEHFVGDAGIRILNDPAFETLCNDKWRTYTLFPTISPRTDFAKTREELREILAGRTVEKVVIKPYDGERGLGIYIGPPSNAPIDTLSVPCIVQEFIDTSAGIPDLVEGHHDFRVIMIGNRVGAAYIRTPPTGSLVANVAQGGKEIPVPLDRIPADALALCKTVDTALQLYPDRCYSTDIGRETSGRWLIIELNAKPGPPKPDGSERYRAFIDMLCDYLADAVA